jgi:PAS domain S-box-containing protein
MARREPDTNNPGRVTAAVRQNGGIKSRVSPSKRVEAILDVMPAAVFGCDTTGKITFFNRKAVEMWGAAPTVDESALGGWRSACTLEGRPIDRHAFPTIVALREGRAVRDQELRVERSDGTWAHISISIEFELGIAGEITGVIGVFHDVTARRLEKPATNENGNPGSEMELRLISAAAPAVLSHWDRDNRLVFASRAFAERWNVPPEALYGKTVAEILGDEAFEAIRGYIDRVLAGEQVAFEIEVPYTRIGMRYIQASYTPDKAPDGTVRGYLAAVVDMTERRLAEIALLQSEERLRMATRTGKIGVWDWDLTSNRVTWTDSLFEIHGVNPEQFDGTVDGVTRLIHPDDRGPVQRAIHSALEHSARYELEFRALRPSGITVWLFTSAHVVRASGQPVRMVGATLDITARKTAELALRESESRFRLLANHAPVGIFLTDPGAECVFANEAMCAMAGQPVERMRGRGWQRTVHPDDRARVVEEWRACVQDRRPFAAEFRYLRPDDSILWIQASAVESRSAAGVLQGHVGTAVDITVRKVTENKLRTQEAQLRLISTNAPIMLAQCDPDERFLFVNRAYASRLGLQPEEIVGRRIVDVLGAEARAALVPFIGRVLAGESIDFEIKVPYRDLGPRFMRVSYVPNRETNGRICGWLSALSDVTRRRETEDALRESEERFRMLADNIAQIAWTTDARGRREWFNRRFQEFMGSKPDGLARDAVMELHHPDHLARVRRKFVRQIRKGEPWEDVFPLRGRDGAYHWFLSRAIPIRNAAGEVVRWFGTNTDITELRAAEEAVQRAQERLSAHAADLEKRVEERTTSLREAIVQMEEFSYTVSHDLRAPLRAMNAYAEALLEDYGKTLDDTAKNYLHRIRRSSERMENLTHDVLAYSRVARSEVELRELDLASILRDLIDQYEELQPAAADLVIEGALARVRGQESWLGQCLANLLTNAVKFMAPGVRPRIRIWSEVRGSYARLWIEDNGIGIPPEFQSNVFQVFARAPTENTYEGTGIGLAIVRKTVEKMGGHCGVESDGQSGSRFWVELVLAR